MRAAAGGNVTAARRDYREFVFTATGRDTDLESFSEIDLHDNLAQELERLRALADLLTAAGRQVDPEATGGAGLLLKDIHDRMREMLAAARGRGHDQGAGH